jgi:arginase family enzyme
MKGLVNVLDFDYVYQAQSMFRDLDCSWIDCSDVMGANRYCELQALLEIKKRLLKGKKGSITFIGNGNYHYVTYLLLSEIQSPFTLVLFDHHSDLMASPSPSLISCGSWVLHAIKRLPMLKKVVMIGVREDLGKAIPEEYKKKVAVFTAKESQWDCNPIKNRILSAIPTRDVYISVDKDVLDPMEASTNWDQGNMKLAQLIHLLQSIYENKQVCGMDICGEQSLSPADLFCREYIQGIRKNMRANQSIIENVLMSMSKKSQLVNYEFK